MQTYLGNGDGTFKTGSALAVSPFTYNGTSYQSPSSIVKWSATTLTTTYISPWQLSAQVPASDYSARPAKLTVGASQSFEVQ
jgi:hypothetical protein